MSQRYIGGLMYNPPGGFSGYFDGSGDYLSAPDNAAWYFTGDFTVECWAYWSSVSSSEANVLAQHRPASAANQAIEFWSNATTLYLAYSSSSVTTTIAANQWYHLAMSCTSGTASCYVNGVRIGTFSMPTRIDSADPFTIGARTGSGGSGATGFFTGYISNVRVINGTGIYSGASFDPPVGPLQAITNTSLLTCAYPTFRDGSSNNFTITVNGNTAVSTQNPFPLTQLPNPALGSQGRGVYSMSQYQALKQQSLWPAIDPYFNYTTLLLHGNGTNGAQNNTFLDSSTNNFTITRNGNTTQGTFTPFGSNWGNYFGATGQYLSVAYSSAFNLTGDFTVECWINPGNLPSSIGSAAQSYERIFSFGTYNAANSLGLEINSNDSGNLRRFLSWYNGTSYGLGPNNAVAPGNWYHIAMVRSGTTITLYLNGTSIGTITGASAAVNTSQAFYIASLQGFEGDASAAFNGYISNFRIVKGTAVYTSNFTPPTSPLTAITNTSLLTCQSNRFVDNSSNAFSISVTGSPSVQHFCPFNPNVPYTVGMTGGSGYFDGSGDYLNGPTTGQFAPTGDFTISMWFYPTSFAAAYYVLAGSWNSGVSDEWLIQYDNTGAIRFLTTTDSTFSAAGVVKLNQWQFLSISRSGSTVTGYINGTSFRSYTLTGTVGSATKTVYVGIQAGSTWPYAGYISDYRLVVGSAQSATPPTSPATAISGTNTLLNFTNAGIIDNAMMNDLETVGNAQISTAQSKFGGSSMYFDGNGDWVNAPPTQNLEFGSGDFTFEFWLYPLDTTRRAIYHGSDGADWSIGIDWQSQKVCIWASSNGSSWNLINADGGGNGIGTITVPLNAWTHVAYVRSGTTWQTYINGVRDLNLTGISGSIVNRATYAKSIGKWFFTNGVGSPTMWNGYIDDLRITKGYARYTANFTPQRSQWQDQ